MILAVVSATISGCLPAINWKLLHFAGFTATVLGVNLVASVAAFIISCVGRTHKMCGCDWRLLALGFVINAVSTSLIFQCLDRLGPARVSVLSRSYVLFAFLLSGVLCGEKMRPTHLLLMSLSVGGGFLFCSPIGTDDLDLIGVTLCLLYCLLFASLNAIIKKCRTELDVAQFVGVICLGPVVATLISVSESSTRLPAINFSVFLSLTGSGLLTFLSLYLLYRSSIGLSFGFATSIRSLAPIFGVLVALLVDPAALGVSQLCGATILLASTVAFGILGEPTQDPASKVSVTPGTSGKARA